MQYNNIRVMKVYEEQFRRRLTQLRMEKGVSSRDMSLTLGQSAGYINGLENGRGMPSMTVFFYICEYFQITPQTFFDESNRAPHLVEELASEMKMISPPVLEHLRGLVKALREK